MRSLKSISSFVASILLIGFTISSGIIIYYFVSTLPRTQMQEVSSQSSRVSSCAGAMFDIKNFYGIYIRPITINNTQNSNTLTDYQVLVTLDTASLISQGKMRTDCGDIRFTDSDGVTQLNYWIDPGCNSANTRIWVKVPNIPASSAKTIYVYYGNSSATSESNGDATFDFFDDFIDNRNNWVVMSGSGSITTFDGISVLNYTGGGCQYVVETAKTVNTPAILEARLYSWSAEPANGGFNFPMVNTTAFGVNDCGETGGDWYLYAPLSNNNANARLWRHSGTSYTKLVDVTSSHPTNTWVRWTLVRNGRYTAYYKDGVKIWEYTDSVDISPGPAYIGWREGEVYIDWIFVRKYTSPEPTTNIGNEEVLPPITFNLFSSGNPSASMGNSFSSIIYLKNGTIVKKDFDIGDCNLGKDCILSPRITLQLNSEVPIEKIEVCSKGCPLICSQYKVS